MEISSLRNRYKSRRIISYAIVIFGSGLSLYCYEQAGTSEFLKTFSYFAFMFFLILGGTILLFFKKMNFDFICPHCLKSVIMSEITVKCPFCFKPNEAYNIFSKCKACNRIIPAFNCPHCRKMIDLLCRYDRNKLDKETYEKI